MSISFHISDLEKAMGAKFHRASGETPEKFDKISTDSRDECEGVLFFPIKGESFDGHDYLLDVLGKGAAGVVFEAGKFDPAQLKSGTVGFEVSDSLRAYQDLAHWLRNHLSPKVVAVTGSNGKSTTKEFAASLISQKYNCLLPEGSFNNHVGVPKTLLNLEEFTEVAVIEMGMNHSGEIQRLVEVASPNVVLVTTVGRAHIENLGSVEKIAEAKEEIYKFAPSGALRIFNLDNPYTRKMYDRYKKISETMTFSQFDPSADVYFRELVSGFGYLELEGKILGDPGRARVEIFGRHNLNNLMAATCLALAVGVESDLVWKGLPKCTGIWGRNQIVKLPGNVTALFDAYNANPDSMEALLSNLSRIRLKGNAHAVFGDMLELGSESEAMHEELGRHARELDFESITFVGQYGAAFERGLKSRDFSKKLIISDSYKQTLASEIWSVIQPGDIIIFKGSRGVKLEKILADMEPENFTLKK